MNSWLCADTNTNLILNGDFEKNAGGTVSFWAKGYTWSGDYKTSKDVDIKHSGQQSVKIENTGQIGRSAWVSSNPVSVKEKTGYRLTIYVKSLNASNTYVQLTCYRGKEKSMDLQYKFLPGTYEWKKYSFNFELPENTEKVRVYLFSTGSGSVWFDDLTFEEHPLPPEEKEKVITRLGIDYYYNPRNQTPDPALSASVTTGNKNGWLLYHRHNPRDTYPDSIPQPAEIFSDEVKNFSTPGQYCALWFSVYALRDLKKIDFKIDKDFSNLEDPNKVIKKENTTFRIIKCWPQLTGWSSRTYYIIPELLENFHPMDIKKQTTQSFWIRVKIPEDTAPGTYQGTVLMTDTNGEKQNIRLKINVLPFKLLSPENNFWSIEADDFRWDNMTDEEMKRDILDITEYGVTSFAGVCGSYPTGYSFLTEGNEIIFKSERLKRFLELRKKLGLKSPFLVVGRIPLENRNRYQDCVRAMDKFIKETSGNQYADWYFIGPDEPHNDPARLKESEFIYPLVQDAGVKTCSYTYLDWSIRKLAPHLNLVVTSYGVQSKEDNQKRRKLLKDFNLKFWYLGGGCYSNMEGGLMPNRYSDGFLFYKSGAEACLLWTYQRPIEQKGDFYDDFDAKKSYTGEKKEYAITYPAKDKSDREVSVSTLQWEGIREGIDDYKYAYTLNEFIKKAESSNNANIRKAGKEANDKLQWLLESIPWAGVYMADKFDNYTATKIRWAIALEIMRLKKLFKEQD
ncbi:MAG: DUF6067 family protein [Victivallaceae bacterium]|nr:DUF6067 family protein [Victivallaceae bacterium]